MSRANCIFIRKTKSTWVAEGLVQTSLNSFVCRTSDGALGTVVHQFCARNLLRKSY